MSEKIKWISETETVKLLGLKDAEMLRRLISRKQLIIKYFQITRKSERLYNIYDVERLQMEYAR